MKVLEHACRVQTDEFIEIARECETKFSHTILCKNLVEYAVNYRNLNRK